MQVLLIDEYADEKTKESAKGKVLEEKKSNAAIPYLLRKKEEPTPLWRNHARDMASLVRRFSGMCDG